MAAFTHPLTHFDVDSIPTFDITLKAPCIITIAGQTQSGKSTLTSKILIRHKEIIDHPMDTIVYCYAVYQPKLFGRLKETVPGIKFHQGLPENFNTFNGDGHKLVVLDDLMTDVSGNAEAVKAFTISSHHYNISIILLVQNLFYKNIRDLVLQSKYICAMKNPRDSVAIRTLGQQMNGGKKNLLVEAATKDLMKKSYGYLVLDYSQTQDDMYRVRSSLFPEDCVLYCN
jgi:hypothetical protein